MPAKLPRASLFFTEVKRVGMVGAVLDQSEVDGFNAILTACSNASWGVADAAYALATAYLETAHTLQPIKENGGVAYFTRMYDITGLRPEKARTLGNLKPGDGARYAGRGYVQLTGFYNYELADKELTAMGLIRPGALILNPDLAMRADLAAIIMVRGMSEGWFSGVKNSTYLPRRGPASLLQFTRARRIINGQDRADLIASHAVAFQRALDVGGWV